MTMPASRPAGNRALSIEQIELRRRTLPRRGMSAMEGATYLGLKPWKFAELVRQGRLPAPKLVDGTRIWDKFELDDAFDDFPKTQSPEQKKESWDY